MDDASLLGYYGLIGKDINYLENYKKLSEALNEYHRLVEAGVWIPRERMVDDIYKVYPFSCNGNALYQGNVVYQQYNS